jgi:hypothetical protein
MPMDYIPFILIIEKNYKQKYSVTNIYYFCYKYKVIN